MSEEVKAYIFECVKMRNFFKKKQPPTKKKKKAKTKNVNLNIPGTMSPTIITLYDRLILFPLYNQARRIVFFFN